jgi:hypothetical protein
MNQVVSFNMERKYAAVMKQCSDLTKTQNRFNELQGKLDERNKHLLNSEAVQKLIQFYNIQELGVKSEYDNKTETLRQDKGVKDLMLSKIINKNNVLMLEKSRYMGLLKKKGKKDKAFDYKNILMVLE